VTALLTEPQQTVLTPTVRGSFRRARFWLIAAAFVAVVVVGYTLLAPPSLTDQPLSPTSTGMTGSRALVQVLRQHGVTTTSTTNLADTESAVGAAASTTVLVYDPDRYLDSAQLARLRGLAAHVVVISPGAKEVKALDPNISLIGNSSAAPSAHCELPAAVNAARIADGGHAYRLAAGASSYSRCFPSGDNDFTLIQHRSNGTTFTVVGSTNSFENRYIADSGNAALAINLLGASKELVWYLPSLEDVGAGGRTETLAEAAPAWFSAFTVLVFLVLIAAAIWRGRRFGPLVVERMPVIVRSSETMEGRARLYQSSSARVRALDSLRIGAITRIGRMCGLPRTAEVSEVARTVATLLGRPLAEVSGVLVDALPSSDAELVRSSDALLQLESDVADATGIRRKPETTDGKGE
jgi:Domain of unknown function (DUF4350)